MFFAFVLRSHPNELRADMQRYYGICLDEVGAGVSVRHAAALSTCLPCGSMTMAKIDPRTSYTETDWLLLGILNRLSSEPVDPFSNSGQTKRPSYSVDEYAERLSRKRKEAAGGN